MAVFTPVIRGTPWSTFTIINQIRLGLTERYNACLTSGSALTTYPPLITHTDVQSASYWNGIQTLLESIVPAYVDHKASTTTFLPAYDLARWRAVAGINSAGFKASTDGVTFTYRKMEVGDVIGHWIFTEIQNGLSALRWTQQIPDILGMTDIWYGGYAIAESRDAAIAAAKASYNTTNGWALHAWGYGLIRGAYSDKVGSGSTWDYACELFGTDVTLTLATPHAGNYNWYFYVRPSEVSALYLDSLPSWVSGPTPASTVFYSQGLAAAENVYTLIANGAGSGATPGSYHFAHADKDTLSIPPTPADNTSVVWGYGIRDTTKVAPDDPEYAPYWVFLLKHTFTNDNPGI